MRERLRRSGASEPVGEIPTDDEIGALVRAVADGWTEPPQRIGRPSWRDRVAGRTAVESARPRTRLRAGLLGQPPGRAGRVTAGALAAIAATVGLAIVVAVIRTAPTAPVGGTPGASGPATTPLPQLQADGTLPFGRIAVLAGTGFATVDLTTGRLLPGALSGWATDQRRLVALPTGDGYVCACITAEHVEGRTVSATLELRWLDADLVERRAMTIGGWALDRAGGADPGDGVSRIILETYAGPAGQLVVGWAVLTPSAWSAGADAIDLTTGARHALVSRTSADPVADPALPGPDVPPVWAPIARFSPSGARATVTLERGTTIGAPGRERWTGMLEGGGPDAFESLPSGALDGDRCATVDEGFTAGDDYFVLCDPGGYGGPLAYRRVSLPAGDLRVTAETTAALGGEFVPRLLDDRGAAMYTLVADRDRLLRLDLATGDVVSADLPTGGSPVATSWLGALERLGDWLVPAAAAKPPLGGAPSELAVHGDRLYVATIGAAGVGGPSGPTRIEVLDAATLVPLASIDLPVSIASLALTRDGGRLLVTGLPGEPRQGCGSSLALPCASGQTPGPPPVREAALFVYDAADGHLRLTAGRLGPSFLLLDPSLVP